MLKTLQAPPPRGSLQEWCLIYLLDRLEDIEHAKFRALAQIGVDKEAGAKAFGEYLEIAFPSIALRKRKKDEETKKVLDWWTSFKTIEVKSMMPARVKSKVKAKKLEGEEHRRADAFYNRIRK